MIYSSPFPDPPVFPEVNAEYFFHSRPDQAEWPDYTQYIDADSGRKISRRKFWERVDAGRTALGSPVSQGGLGIKADNDEMVGILNDNSTEYAVLVHSLLGLAVPFCLLSGYSTKFELAHTIRLSGVTRLFVHSRLMSLASAVSKEVGFPAGGNIFVLGDRDRSLHDTTSFAEIIDRTQKQNTPTVEIQPVTFQTLAYLVFSSGTTGLPKAVMITQGNLIYSLSQAATLGQCIQAVHKAPSLPTPEGIPVALAFLPFYHCYGLNAFVFRPFLSPMTCVVLPKWSIETALEVIPKYHVTDIFLVPSIAHQLTTNPAVRKADLRTLRTVNCGAAHLPRELADNMTKVLSSGEFRVSEAYGMSEMTSPALVHPLPGILGDKLAKPLPRGSAGVLFPGMQARIAREDGTDAEPDEVGELYFRGSCVSVGYWNDKKATSETYVDGWLRTGDRFRADKDGYFFFDDRAKDTLKVSGAQVSPTEIENVLLSHPDKLISDATVAGVGGGGRTSDEKVPRAWIVLSPTGSRLGGLAVIKELEKWHRKNLSKHKWLRGGFEVVREIPKSPTGKTLKRVLQDQYEAKLKNPIVKL